MDWTQAVMMETDVSMIFADLRTREGEHPIRTFVALYVKESQLSSSGGGEESAAAEAEASS